LSGWIKWEKDLESDPRVLRMARELKRTCNAMPFHPVTLVCGGLLRMWSYADSHIREDDTLDLGCSELDEIIGIENFCSLLPEDWLREINEKTVELPNFQEHNGVEAKRRALTQKRVQRHRNGSGVTGALPDQDQTRPDQKKAAEPLVLHESLPADEWEEWLAHRREKRLSMSPRALKKQLKLLAEYDTESQRKIIDTSINAGWEGLFPLKDKLQKHANGSGKNPYRGAI
jgi:hypothetical protein